MVEIDDKFKMLFDFAKQAFEDVVKEVTEEEIHTGESFDISEESKQLLSIIIGFSGVTNGRILLNTSIADGKNIAVAMNFGEELEKEEDLYMMLAEFANMFCGRTATYINNAFGKREIWISPPAIFSASDLDIVTPHVASMLAHYECSLGKFVLDTGFSDEGYDEF